METLKEVDTTVIFDPTKFTLFIIVFLVVGTGLTMYLFFETGSLFILFLGISLAFGSPLIFQKAFRRKFSQSVSAKFSEDYFSIEFKEFEGGNILRTDINRFDQIKFFKTYDSTKNDFSNLKLIFKDGTKLRYTFSGQSNNAICETDINFLVRNAIASYNLPRPLNE